MVDQHRRSGRSKTVVKRAQGALPQQGSLQVVRLKTTGAEETDDERAICGTRWGGGAANSMGLLQFFTRRLGFPLNLARLGVKRERQQPAIEKGRQQHLLADDDRRRVPFADRGFPEQMPLDRQVVGQGRCAARHAAPIDAAKLRPVAAVGPSGRPSDRQ